MSYRFLLLLIPFFSQAQTAVEKGRKLWEAKNPKEAREILLTIDDESSDYAEAQFYLGRISYDAKKFDDAKDYFEEATVANPKVAEYFNFLGNTYGLIAQDGNIITQGMYVPK